MSSELNDIRCLTRIMECIGLTSVQVEMTSLYLHGNDKSVLTWKWQVCTYMELTRLYLHGNDKFVLTWKWQVCTYMEMTSLYLHGNDNSVLTWKWQVCTYMEMTSLYSHGNDKSVLTWKWQVCTSGSLDYTRCIQLGESHIHSFQTVHVISNHRWRHHWEQTRKDESIE